jgi:hypothetical protein
LSEKGVALTARDQVKSELEQAIADKKQALDLQISAFDERREAVERIEELHLQVVELTRELSWVPELRDASWAVGFNWGFEHYRGVAKSAPPGDESFKDLDISTIQIPDEALETMAKLGVDQFPHITDWSPKTSQPAPARKFRVRVYFLCVRSGAISGERGRPSWRRRGSFLQQRPRQPLITPFFLLKYLCTVSLCFLMKRKLYVSFIAAINNHLVWPYPINGYRPKFISNLAFQR